MTDQKDLIKTAHINWCIDIFRHMEKILHQYPDNFNDGLIAFDYSDIAQLKYLVKQGLQVEKKED